jgi:hypothetical protein
VNPGHMEQCRAPIDYNVRGRDKLLILRTVSQLKSKGEKPMGRPRRKRRREKVVIVFKDNCQNQGQSHLFTILFTSALNIFV